jgi:hypothetical protein
MVGMGIKSEKEHNLLTSFISIQDGANLCADLVPSDHIFLLKIIAHTSCKSIKTQLWLC